MTIDDAEILTRITRATKKPAHKNEPLSRVKLIVPFQDRQICASWSTKYTTAHEYAYAIHKRWNAEHQQTYYTAERSLYGGQQRRELLLIYRGDCLATALNELERNVI